MRDYTLTEVYRSSGGIPIAAIGSADPSNPSYVLQNITLGGHKLETDFLTNYKTVNLTAGSSESVLLDALGSDRIQIYDVTTIVISVRATINTFDEIWVSPVFFDDSNNLLFNDHPKKYENPFNLRESSSGNYLYGVQKWFVSGGFSVEPLIVSTSGTGTGNIYMYCGTV